MAAENPTWGAPRIHSELLKFGFEISESTVSRCLAQGASSRDSGKRWLTFLNNHREAIAAIDFLTVPTATFCRPSARVTQLYSVEVTLTRNSIWNRILK